MFNLLRLNAIRLEEKEMREKEVLSQISDEADEFKVDFYRKREITVETNKATNREKEKVRIDLSYLIFSTFKIIFMYLEVLNSCYYVMFLYIFMRSSLLPSTYLCFWIFNSVKDWLDIGVLPLEI